MRGEVTVEGRVKVGVSVCEYKGEGRGCVCVCVCVCVGECDVTSLSSTRNWASESDTCGWLSGS